MTTGDDLDLWERRLEERVAADTSIRDTDREAIITARRGQGLFKQRVMQIETKCRITGVDYPVHLVASHCRPWRDSTNDQRLDGENGLLLTPSVDHLFDRGFFHREDGEPLPGTLLDHQQATARILLKWPSDFVLHSLRHTFGTRLGESGADAFTIMRLMGHSTVAVSQRYVHPSPEAVELAFERLTALSGVSVPTNPPTADRGHAKAIQ